MKKNTNHDVWTDDFGDYGSLLKKRATGQMPEMESSKALAHLLDQGLYKEGMSILDVGCGAGHYLRSFKKVLGDVDYTGCDITKRYIKYAREVFPDANFKVADIHSLPFQDKSFDIVTSNNVLYHLPPPPKKALKELLRVSRKYVVVRTLIGESNYLIKEYSPLYEDGKFNHFNIYTREKYVSMIGKAAKIEFLKDDQYGAFDNRGNCGVGATRVENGLQITGNIVNDFHFILIQI